MEHELWSILSVAIQDVKRARRANAYHTHDHDRIIRVYLWAVLHDRPVSWACHAQNWGRRTRPATLPSQSCVSRRLRTEAIQQFLEALGRRLVAMIRGAWAWLKIIDGKPLVVAAHSKDPDIAWGRGAGQQSKGYKLYAVYDGSPMPCAWQVEPMDRDERVIARQLIPRLCGGGYLLGDAVYDDSALFGLAAEHGHRLLAPRARRYVGLGHRRHSEHRLSCIANLETPGARGASNMSQAIMRARRLIETLFGNLTSFGGGLTCLPPWVRRLHRVKLYVQAKLLINAARIISIHA